MKKAVLKTILKDFFKLKYPLAMILVIIVLGAGVVWATGYVSSGYRLNHNTPNYSIGTLNLQGAVLTNTSASNDYFIPTKTQTEWKAFLAHCPAGVKVIPASSPAGTYYNSSIRCTDTNLSCPTDFYCINGKKIACPVGEHSPSGSSAFTACTPAAVPCTPSPACLPADQCGTDNCGNTCGPVCPATDFCNNHHQCQPNCSIDPLNPC